MLTAFCIDRLPSPPPCAPPPFVSATESKPLCRLFLNFTNALYMPGEFCWWNIFDLTWPALLAIFENGHQIQLSNDRVYRPNWMTDFFHFELKLMLGSSPICVSGIMSYILSTLLQALGCHTFSKMLWVNFFKAIAFVWTDGQPCKKMYCIIVYRILPFSRAQQIVFF